jgi:hypothetical protein
MNPYLNKKVPIPEKISSEEKLLFENKSNYRVKSPEIKHLKKVFVSHEGLVLKNGLLVQGCAFNLKGKQDNTFYYPFWRSTIEQYAVCKWGKSLASIHLKGPQQYLLIHSKWFNYAFWINGFLPRLIQAEEAGLLKSCKLIVPEGWQKIHYVWESLKAFDVEMEIVPDGVHLFVDCLIMPETREWTATFYPPLIQKTRDRLVLEAQKKITRKDFPNKIYLTRAQRGLRCVENEEEVIDYLQTKGYKAITFENLSIWEQITMMNQATHFISLHGAGFANILFMKENSYVLELINRQYAQLEYTFPFWKLANCVGLNYNAQFCDIVNIDKVFQLKFSTVNKDKNYDTFLVNQNVYLQINKIPNYDL